MRGVHVVVIVVAMSIAIPTVAVVSVAQSVIADVGVEASVGLPARFSPVGPLRLMDTRLADCHCTRVDASTIRVAIGGIQGVPSEIEAAAITVTATNMTLDGFVTAYPAGGPRPETS